MDSPQLLHQFDCNVFDFRSNKITFSLVVNVSVSKTCCLLKPKTIWLDLNNSLRHISIVSSSGMFVKRESASREAINNSELWKLPIEDHELEKVKTENKKEAYSSFDNYNFWNELNINKEVFLALTGLYSNKDIILQKVDKGNSAVLVNKADYTKRMKKLLLNVSKLNMERKLISYYNMKAN